MNALGKKEREKYTYYLLDSAASKIAGSPGRFCPLTEAAQHCQVSPLPLRPTTTPSDSGTNAAIVGVCPW